MSSQRPLMFYGWLVVGFTLLAMALSAGTDRSFGVAVIPLSAQFGWSRATLSTVVLVTGIVTSLFQLMIGVLVDRFGPRYVLVAGVACLGVTVWLLTVATTIWEFGLAYGLLGGLGLAATRQVVAATLVGNWFILRRGLLQGLVGSAGALGEMLVVPLNMFLERDYGWQGMYRSMGTVLLVGVLPCIWAFVRNRPEDVGLHPYGATSPRGAATTGPSRPTEGIPFRQALANPQTWVLIYLGFA
ncbi:MAG: MFS transporter [Nitrospinae bacterium]|nr:MFS transporter [Nitrospinota bacterium]